MLECRCSKDLRYDPDIKLAEEGVEKWCRKCKNFLVNILANNEMLNALEMSYLQDAQFHFVLLRLGLLRAKYKIKCKTW